MKKKINGDQQVYDAYVKDEAIISNYEALVQEYACCPDNELDDDALMLKVKMLNSIKLIGAMIISYEMRKKAVKKQNKIAKKGGRSYVNF